MQTLNKIPGKVLESETIQGSFYVSTVEQPNPGFNNMEIWKDIPGFEGMYQISNKGNVKSFKYNKDRLLKLTKNNKGYYYVKLSKDNCKHFYVHRLIGKTFIQNPKNKPCINHKNGIKTDNRVENLEFCTYSYNMKHAYELGLIKPAKTWLGKFGAEHNRSKAVFQFDLNGIFIKEYGSLCEAHRDTNIYNIPSVCRGKIKQAGGYIWKFKT